jgi:ribosome-binding protein aMBF1 (putative translation factor)
MKFSITQDWLRRHLKQADDSNVAAAGTTLDELERDAQRRTVTPLILASVPTDIGKVVRYIREQKGWSREDLSKLADVDLADIVGLESTPDYSPSPRAAVCLADVLGLSRTRFQEKLGMRVVRDVSASTRQELKWAAHSKAGAPTSDEDFEAIRALVKALSAE